MDQKILSLSLVWSKWATIGPDGCVYVCNNGGFEWHNIDGLLIPGGQGDNYSGGRMKRLILKLVQ